MTFYLTEKMEGITTKHHRFTPLHLLTSHNCRSVVFEAASPSSPGASAPLGKLVRNASNWAPLQTYWIRAICAFNKCSRWFWWTLEFQNQCPWPMRVFVERISLFVYQTSVYHQLKNMAPSNLFVFHIPILPLLDHSHQHTNMLLSPVSSSSYHPFLYSSLQQNPKEEAITYSFISFFIPFNPLQSGFHLNSSGTSLVEVTSDSTLLILSSQLIWLKNSMWHCCCFPLIHFLHVDSNTAYPDFPLISLLFLLNLLGWFLYFLSSWCQSELGHSSWLCTH